MLNYFLKLPAVVAQSLDEPSLQSAFFKAADVGEGLRANSLASLDSVLKLVGC